MADSHRQGLWMAEFESPDSLRDAVRLLRQRGYTRLETYSPYEVPGVASLLERPRSRLPVVAFVAGAGGAIGSYLVQWYTNAVSYPQNIGGRPAHATTAFIVPTFEGTILLAALATFFGVLASLRLPRLWKPVFEVDGFERATIDRFWVTIDEGDQRSGEEVTSHELATLGAVRVVELRQEEGGA